MKYLAYLCLTLMVGLAGPIVQDARSETLVLAFGGVPGGFDGDALQPYTQNAVVQINEPLFAYRKVTDADGKTTLDYSEIVGALAESHEVIGDGRRVEVKLKEGVLSPYGNELTAADVVWSWNKSFDQKRTGNFLAGVAGVTAVEEVSEYVVAFILREPSSLLLPVLTVYAPGIYDSTEMKKHATEEDPWGLQWLQTNTASFGPYTVQSVRPYEQATFVANPNYYGDKPHFDTVIMRAVPSAAARITLLKSGQVHYIERPSFQQVKDLEGDSAVQVESTDGRLFAAMWMNANFEPFDELKVRQALNHAIDRQSIIDSVFFGYANAGDTIISPMLPGYVELNSYPYDPEKAKELLAEAGVEGDLSFEIIYSDIFPWQEQGAIQLSAQFAKIGVTATPRKIMAADMRAAMAPTARSMPAFVLEDGPIIPDAVYNIALVTVPEGVSNRNNYSNQEVSELVAEAKTTADPERRLEIIGEVQKLVAADAPYILLGFPRIFEAMNPKITGWVPRPDDHPRWADFQPK